MRYSMQDHKKNSKEGQGVMEYLIITGLVGIFCLVAVKKFGKSINTRIQLMTSQIYENLDLH